MQSTAALPLPAEPIAGNMNEPITRHITLPLGRITTQEQVRTQFEPGALESLAASLKGSGQHVPVLVYRDEARGFVLLDGERRYRAAKLAGLETLDAVVLPERPSPEALVLAQLEIDAHRKDLDPIDQAAGFAKAMEANGWNATELAGRIHVALTTVTRAVALLDLPADMQAQVRSRELPAATARELARLTEEGPRRAALEHIQAEGMTSAQAQRYVSNLLKPKKKAGRPKSKDRHAYKNLGGYDAVVTPTRITLVTSGKVKGDILTALELLLAKCRLDLAPATPA